MGSYALLGEKLGHSFSPRIHGMLCSYEYGLEEVPKQELAHFLENTALDGMNVTIPYKKDVLPYCSQLSDAVKRIGSANTLVRCEDGWHAHNTDYFGFIYMLRRQGYSPRGRKAVVLGTGGASVAVVTALEDMGASEIVVVSRKGENNYDNLHLHADADVLVNATPVGMYPNNGSAAVSLDSFPACRAVFDLVYNPARTKLIMDAESRGLIHSSGLSMLVAQAHAAAELFTGEKIDAGRIEEILRVLEKETENIVLIGMPGCGKSSVGRELGRITGRFFVDSDDEFERVYGISPAEMIVSQGEDAFRRAETEVLSELGKRSGLVIATGGGCVTREENYPLLHQNSSIFFLERSIEKLPTGGRPLSQSTSLEQMYKIRKPLYESFADHVTDNDSGSVAHTAAMILETFR